MTILINPENPDGTNQEISKEELDFIRSLGDFDLIMLISEIHDNGWVHSKYPTVGGKALIALQREAIKKRAGQ